MQSSISWGGKLIPTEGLFDGEVDEMTHLAYLWHLP